jgi:hypothetical protein
MAIMCLGVGLSAARGLHRGLLLILCVPITSSTSCDQVIFVDQAADPSSSSDAVQVEVDRLG